MTHGLCSGCRFYDESDDVSGLCRQAHPTVVMTSYPMAMWHIVKKDDWCGDWRPQQGSRLAESDI